MMAAAGQTICREKRKKTAAATLTTSDTAEAMAAYLERREPRFEGR